MFFTSLRGYRRLARHSESESFLSAGQKDEYYDNTVEHTQRARRTNTMATLGGWILSALLAVCLVFEVYRPIPALEAMKVTSAYSPIMDSIPASLREVQMNGSFHFPSIYRGEPALQVDAAWDRVSTIRPLDLPLTDAQFLRIGQSVETAARNPPEYGGGFYVQPEFTHQLHCVNLLRKVSFFKFDYYNARDPDFTENTELFKTHIDHCVEMLRQFVMCHADVGLVTAHWIDQRRAAWPDFNTHKVCRDFERILDWARDRQLPVGVPLRPAKPEGATALPAPP